MLNRFSEQKTMAGILIRIWRALLVGLSGQTKTQEILWKILEECRTTNQILAEIRDELVVGPAESITIVAGPVEEQP